MSESVMTEEPEPLEIRFTITSHVAVRGTPDEVRALFGLNGTDDEMLPRAAGLLASNYPDVYGGKIAEADWIDDYSNSSYSGFKVFNPEGFRLFPET